MLLLLKTGSPEEEYICIIFFLTLISDSLKMIFKRHLIPNQVVESSMATGLHYCMEIHIHISVKLIEAWMSISVFISD
jgi:hypothetical protein